MIRLLALLVITGLGGAALAQDSQDAVLTEKTTHITDHVDAIMGFPNIGIVTGSKATLVVDTGLGKANGALITRVAKRLSKGSRLYLVTTHYHPEHAAGEIGFPADTILVRSAVQQDELTKQGPALLALFRKLAPQWGKLLEGVSSMRTPDIIFDKEMKIDLGGVTARILYYGPAHTRGDQLIFVEPDSVLISGDVVQNLVVPQVRTEGGSYESWLKVLDQLALLKPRYVLPTHSQPGDGSLITKESAFLRDMRSRTLAMKKQGLSVADAGKRLTEDFKKAWPDYAKSKDWPNLEAVPNFVEGVYAESK